MSEPDVPTPPPQPQQAAPRTAATLARALALTLVPIALGAGLLAAALWWLLHNEDGTRWLLHAVPGVTVTAPRGSLLGDFGADRVEIALSAAPEGAAHGDRIVATGLQWKGLGLAWPQAPTSWVRVRAASVRAERVDVEIASDPDAPPLAPPGDLALPFELELDALQIGALHTTPLGAQPLRELRAAIAIGAGGGSRHRIDGLAFGWDRVDVRGDASVATAPPMVVESNLAITPRAAADVPVAFDATLTLRGPLDRLALEATLRGAASGDPRRAAPQSLDLTATVLPFAPWPVASLSARTQSLDLAALSSSAPRTALNGTVEVHSVALDHPATVEIELDNARAGRADEGLLPLRSLRADLRARPDAIDNIEIHRLALELGTARARGGSVTASGAWAPGRAMLDARFDAIAPQLLDARAPPMRLAGSASLQADDWFAAGAAPPHREPRFALRGRIDGSVPVAGRNEAVQLELDATATAQRIVLRQASVQAGAARADLAAQALRQPAGAWQVTGQGRLARFDPSLWWAGAQGSAPRAAKHDLNGTLDVALLVAANPGAMSIAQFSQSRGRATLELADSTLAGMPLSGTLALNGEGNSGLAASAKLSLVGAGIGVQGRLAPDAASDHWEIDARAADLAPLSPLLALLRATDAKPVTLSGTAELHATVDGRWPQLMSRGSVELAQLAAGASKADSAKLQWKLGSTPQAPLDIGFELAQASAGERKLDRLSVALQGTFAEHRIAIDAESPARPPEWIDQLHGAAARAVRSNGTIAELRASGALQFDSAWQQPLQWTVHLQQLQARRRGGDLQAPWFSAKGFDIVAQYDPPSATPQLELSPGRAELTNVALRWSKLRLRGGETPAAEIQAEVEPFAVAPLLARVQPEFGWSGDLVVGGRIVVHSAPTFTADIELGLRSGDLSVTDEVETHRLELSDLRIALAAQDGVWHFTHALAGRKLGAMAGAATVRTSPTAIWPPAGAPLQGVSELRIDDLGAWGAWVPAGWRMRGALQASASFAGQFGAPEFTGHIVGSGLGMRNLLEGIDLHDGELEVALQGETAQIVKLRARGGDGSLTVSGGATFGAAPQVKLRAVADKLLLLGRVDRRVVVSGDAALQIDPKRIAADGAIRIDSGLFDVSHGNAPTLGSDVTVLREPSPEPAPVGARAASGGRDVDARLGIDLGDALRVRGHGLNTLLRGKLMLTTPGGRMALDGTVTTYRGTYAAYNQKLEIARGVIAFNGAPENPRLDILALRPDIDVSVGVAIGGTAATPRISLFSEPDMPDNEKLSWLVLGRAPSDLGGSDFALLQAAAAALLAGEGTTPGAQLIGLDLFSVRQTAGEVRDTIVSVGKQLSRRWYIGYERSLSSAAGNWQLIYRLARRFTLRLQTGLDNSIDLIWTWRWE